MSEQDREQAIQRILVALDASAHSLSALEAAVKMAAQFQADLLGLFVEDANVQRLAEIPFAQEIGSFSARRRRVDGEQLIRQVRAQVSRVRRHFRTQTRRAELTCTFRTTRGRVVTEVLTAADDVDVVILGKEAWAAIETGCLGPAVRQVLAKMPVSALILSAGARLTLPLSLVYDGSPLADKALLTAAAMAKQENGHLTIFILAANPERAEDLQEQARRRLEGQDLRITYERMNKKTADKLTDLAAQARYGTIVLPAEMALMRDEAVLDFLDETNIPVLLVR
jgi:nucleotide-binding universal stress UspA family protein